MTTTLAPRTSLPGTLRADGYSLPADLTFDEWRGVLDTLHSMQRSVNWWIGDTLVYGERRFPDRHSQALPTAEEDPTGASQSVLKQGRQRLDLGDELSHQDLVGPVRPVQSPSCR